MYSVWITKVFVDWHINPLFVCSPSAYCKLLHSVTYMIILCITCYDITPWCYIWHHGKVIYLVECDTYVMAMDVVLCWQMRVQNKTACMSQWLYSRERIVVGQLWGTEALKWVAVALKLCFTLTVSTWTHYAKPYELIIQVFRKRFLLPSCIITIFSLNFAYIKTDQSKIVTWSDYYCYAA